MLLAYNKFLKYVFLFTVGGFAYGGIEIIFRGYSHISMFIAGGLCFILIGLLNEVRIWDLSILSQMLLSAGIVTLVEFAVGVVVNVWMGLEVWNYTELPMNIHGQVCVLFTAIWFMLSPIAILFDDYLRYRLMGEDKPVYHLLPGSRRKINLTYDR